MARLAQRRLVVDEAEVAGDRLEVQDEDGLAVGEPVDAGRQLLADGAGEARPRSTTCPSHSHGVAEVLQHEARAGARVGTAPGHDQLASPVREQLGVRRCRVAGVHGIPPIRTPLRSTILRHGLAAVSPEPEIFGPRPDNRFRGRARPP